VLTADALQVDNMPSGYLWVKINKINPALSRVILHLSMAKGVKLPPPISPVLRHIETKFQRLFGRGRGADLTLYCPRRASGAPP